MYFIYEYAPFIVLFLRNFGADRSDFMIDKKVVKTTYAIWFRLDENDGEWSFKITRKITSDEKCDWRTWQLRGTSRN